MISGRNSDNAGAFEDDRRSYVVVLSMVDRFA